MKKLRGFTLIELLIVVAIIAILAAIAVPNFLEAQTRSKVSRVRSDHRSLATAIETYYIDNNTYPAATTTRGETMDTSFYNSGADGDQVGSTFRRRGDADNNLSITTPIAYITSNFPDPFADTRGIGFRYWTDGKSWILGSFGPNVDELVGGDMGWADAPITKQTGGNTWWITTIGEDETWFSSNAQPSQQLLGGPDNGEDAFTYDPTNGTISNGDVWRVKQ